MELWSLQEQVEIWQKKNFKNKKPHQPLLGVTEEVGELCHAHLKNEQGIRGTPEEHYLKKMDAIGDIVIYLCDYCTQNKISINDAVIKAWDEVSKRDWTRNKKNGVKK